MKQILALAAPLALVACGGTGTLALSLAHDDTQTANALVAVGQAQSAVSVDPLATAVHVWVRIAAIDVHLTDDSGPDTVDPSNPQEEPSDDDGAWQSPDVSKLPDPFDLMSVTATAEPIPSVELPTGKITQIRLRLKPALPDEAFSTTSDVYAGAICLSADGTGACTQSADLVVPHSAIDPGVKIYGLFESVLVEKDKTVSVQLNLQLVSDPTCTSNCTYAFVPELRIESVVTH